jgi:hypothetical protein
LKARSSIVDLILEQEESSINFLTVALKPNWQYLKVAKDCLAQQFELRSGGYDMAATGLG